MDVGSRIKTAREELGISQVELAERIDVSPSIVAKWETNTRTPLIGTLTRIAHATDKELHFLFEDGEAA